MLWHVEVLYACMLKTRAWLVGHLQHRAAAGMVWQLQLTYNDHGLTEAFRHGWRGMRLYHQSSQNSLTAAAAHAPGLHGNTACLS